MDYPERSRTGLGLGQALAAVREGDTLVVTKLDRLARFLFRTSEKSVINLKLRA